MRGNTIFIGVLTACSFSMLGGCAHQYEPEAGFGSSVREAIARQAINPNGVGVDGVEPGMDGASAKATIDRYLKTMEKPPSLGDVLKIGVDAGGGQ
jgi:hypothetical protein